MISRSEFTVEKAKKLQANTVTIWAAKLRPEVLEALKQRIQFENDNLPKDATGYDVFRGDQITNAVIETKLKGGNWICTD